MLVTTHLLYSIYVYFLNQNIFKCYTDFRKGLVYYDVPIYDDDHIIVSTLGGFVMNRVLGDNFENLLYKIFVSIDEHTSVSEVIFIYYYLIYIV